MQADRLQTTRYEFKYVIDESTARKVREFVGSQLEPDNATVGREGIGYPVHSLYLDSPDLRTCRAVIQGERNRFKLRVRFYGDTGPIFFEIKRRLNLVILKERAAVKRTAAQVILDGAGPDAKFLKAPEDPSQFEALYNFCTLRDRIQAEPAAYTSYMREGYERRGNNAVRVTFDRLLRAGPYQGRLSAADVERWTKPEMGGVVLELKFTDRFPEWMHTLVECFNLTRRGFAKYVKCASIIHGFTTTK